MPTSSPDKAAIARNNERLILQARNSVKGTVLAKAIGWTETKLSRFFGDPNNPGKSDASSVAGMLAELDLAVYPAHFEVYDPEAIAATLGFAKFAGSRLKPHHLKN